MITNNLCSENSVAQVAQFLKVSTQQVNKLIRTQKLGATLIGKHYVISPKQIQEYLDRYEVMIEPDDHARNSEHLPEIVALSFFSGAMGLDIGMELGGIKSLLACECNKYCRITIAKNNPDIALIGDITNYSAKQILDMAKIPDHRKVDIMFGGPPCQSFSTAGARKSLDDARGNVFLHFLDLVAAIKPTYVVIENVRGLLSAPYPVNDSTQAVKGGALYEIINRLNLAGYQVSFELYNAANFGAPQIRERVVIIGKLGHEKVAYLTPTHCQNPQDYKDTACLLLPWKTLQDAFDEHLDKEACAHPHHINFPDNRLRFFKHLKAGQYWKDLPLELQIEAMGNKLNLAGGKTGFFRRLALNKPAPTLVTDPTMPATDLCHPTELRPLSVEEYQAIQEFPRSWKICGPLKEQYRQLGNAVPIKLGMAIAKTILADMQGIKEPPLTNFRYSRYKNTDEQSFLAHMSQIIKHPQHH